MQEGHEEGVPETERITWGCGFPSAKRALEHRRREDARRQRAMSKEKGIFAEENTTPCTRKHVSAVG